MKSSTKASTKTSTASVEAEKRTSGAKRARASEGTSRRTSQQPTRESADSSFGSGIRGRLSSSIEAAAKIDRTQLAWGLAGTAAVGAGAYFLYRSWTSGNLSAFVKSIEERLGFNEEDLMEASETVPEGLPLGVSGQKPSPSIRDEEGNYDIDGVSFDTHGVVVGSDNTKTSSQTT